MNTGWGQCSRSWCFDMAWQFLSGRTSILTNFGKDATFAQAQWELVGLADAKLTFHVQQCLFKQIWPAENVVNDDFCDRIVIYDKTWLLGKRFPLAVDIVNEIDKHRRSVHWSKGHDGMCPLDGILALEGKLFLTRARAMASWWYPMGGGASHNQKKIARPNSSLIAKSQCGIG